LNLQQYKKQRVIQTESQFKNRTLCTDCWQPDFSCYCHKIEKFDANIEFVILIHPIETRRRIATGRMAFLTLENSHLIRGTEFANCNRINKLLEDKNYKNVLLARRADSIDITAISEAEKKHHFKSDKKLRIFVLDGTWSNAGKMITRSPNLQILPTFCFTPTTPSNIRVRKQPNPLCYCTLEAIHHTIGLLGPSQGLDTKNKIHDQMLKPFDWMVDLQIKRQKIAKFI
jgi:DTW domain-containing protein YfiP